MSMNFEWLLRTQISENEVRINPMLQEFCEEELRGNYHLEPTDFQLLENTIPRTFAGQGDHLP